MKKLIFLIMLAVTMAAQGSNPVSSTHRIMQQTDGATYFTDYSNLENVKVINHNRTDKRQNAPEEDEIEVPIELNDDIRMRTVWAIPSDAEDTSIIYKEQNGYFSLPKGVYDILIIGFSLDGRETIILVYDKMSLDKDTIIKGSSDDAKLSVNIIPKGPNGILIQSNENNEGNIISGDQVLEILWKEHRLLGMGDGINYNSRERSQIRTNQISENFKFTRVDQYLWSGGVTGMILPIDFTKTEISPTLSNWQTMEVNFCQTPLNINKKSISDYNAYSRQFSTLINNNDFLTIGTAGECRKPNLIFNENKIDLWCPEDYDSEYEMWVYPTGSCVTPITGPAPAIMGMPLKRGETGLYQVGINPSDFGAYNYTSEGLQLNGNPRYSGEIQYTILGNCAPILTTIPWRGAAFRITYTGRYGENLQIDATGYPKWEVNWTEEQREILGLPVCEVAIDVDGEQICNFIDNWNDINTYSGVFDAEISTDNILIDETVKGLSAAKIHYDSNIGNGTAPTLTALQFRNNNDKVTDRLDSPTDGYLEFYALAPIPKVLENKRSTYYDTGELQSVKAEWSPMGQDNWKEIELAEIPELFYLPGFGYCFRGYLNGVDKESDNKWYDLRVRIEDTYGAYQEQTISPAFRIESITDTGIQSISASSKAITVYSIDGKTVMTNATENDLNTLPSGLYIVHNGNRTRKIAIP